MQTVKRREVGIAGAIIVLSQALTSFQSTDSISKQVKELQLELQSSKIEREQYFVRKTELAAVVSKLDKLSTEVSVVKDQVSAIKSRMEETYSLEECDLSVPPFACKEVSSR